MMLNEMITVNITLGYRSISGDSFVIRKHYVTENGISTEGWLTTVRLAGKQYEKFFPLRRGGEPTAEIWNQYQKKRARYYDARWKAREAALQYRRFIRTSSPKAGLRGSGVHGIELEIAFEGSSNDYLCYFVVGLESTITKVAITSDRPLNKAWERAVRTWGRYYEIREKDIARVLLNVPTVDAFERLRSDLNKSGSERIPSRVTKLTQSRTTQGTLRKTLQKKVMNSAEALDDVASFAQGLQQEIAQFQKSRRKR